MKQFNEEIILCTLCDGEGILPLAAHRQSDSAYMKKCHKCKGSGRILQTTIVKGTPFKPDNAP